MERSSGAAPRSQPPDGDPTGAVTLGVRIEESGGASIVALAGELDLNTISRMEGPLVEQLTQRPAVLVDLSGVTFIDSSGIGVLIQAFRTSNGTPMHILISSGSQVERVFRIAGILEALPVSMDRGKALADLNGNGAAQTRGELN